MNKKAALSLSMNTIVVIVIGVTILSLGLIWVQNTFRGIEDITDQAFDGADEVLSSDSEFGGRLSASSSLTLQKGQAKILVVQVRNDGSINSDSFSITPPRGSSGELQGCVDAKIIGPSSKQIKEGEVQNFDVGFLAQKSCESGTDFYNIGINGASYATHSVTITVE